MSTKAWDPLTSTVNGSLRGGGWPAGGGVGARPWQAPEGSFARQNSMLWRNQPDGAISRDLEVIVGEDRRPHANALLCIRALRRRIAMVVNLNFIFISFNI